MNANEFSQSQIKFQQHSLLAPEKKVQSLVAFRQILKYTGVISQKSVIPELESLVIVGTKSGS